MPVAVHRGLSILVACPLKRKPVDVETCYRCPFYIKRDGDFVYCRYEISRELESSPVHVIAKNPVIVETSTGAVYRVSIHNPDGELVLDRIG